MPSCRYAAYVLARMLAGRLPPALAQRCAEGLAARYARRAVAERANIRANLSLILGALLPEDSPLIREVFRHFAWYLAEFLAVHRTGLPPVQFEGAEHLERARAAGRGVIVMTAHLGNWELGAMAIRALLRCPVAALAQPHEDPRINRLFDRQRWHGGVAVIPVGPQAAMRSLQVLRGGGVLGLLGDWPFSDPGVAVTLFGRRAMVPLGPAILSLRAQAPIVPCACVRLAPGRFRMRFDAPIEPPRAGAQAAGPLAQRYAAALEGVIRQAPTQWVRFTPVAAGAQTDEDPVRSDAGSGALVGVA